MKTPWPDQEKEDFRQWHEARLKECEYPLKVVLELTQAREDWLATIPTIKE